MPTKSLEDHQIKALLHDVEAEDLDREDIVFKNICKRDAIQYGAAGSDLRRKYQKHWTYVKAMSIERYVEYLEEHGVPPSATSSNFLRTRGTEKNKEKEGEEVDSKIPSSASKVNKVNTSKVVNDDDDDDWKINEDDLDLDFEGLNLLDDDDNENFDGNVLKNKTPTTVKYSPHRGAPGSLTPFGNESKMVGELMATSNGTKDKPWIVIVNLGHPERNREFDIEFVQGMKAGTHQYNGYHIRMAVDPNDVMRYKAHLPIGSDINRGLRDILKRSVIVKGPSNPSWLRNSELYHKKSACDITKRAHKGTELEISRDPKRKDQYWLLIFPRSTVLDNQVFSGHPTDLKRNVVPMEIKGSSNEFGKTIYGLAIYWVIAEKYGGRQIESDTDDEVDLTRLFG